MSVTAILDDIFRDSLKRANIKAQGSMDKSCLYRSFIVEIPNANNFRFGYIYTENGVRECEPDTTNPTLKILLSFEVFSAILNKKIGIQEAIYHGLVTLVGENPLLHMNSILLLFGNLI